MALREMTEKQFDQLCEKRGLRGSEIDRLASSVRIRSPSPSDCQSDCSADADPYGVDKVECLINCLQREQGYTAHPASDREDTNTVVIGTTEQDATDAMQELALDAPANMKHKCTEPGCVFSRATPGLPASVVRFKKCMWCDPEQLAAALADTLRHQNIKQSLNAFKSKDQKVHERALAKLPDNFVEGSRFCSHPACVFSRSIPGSKARVTCGTERSMCMWCDEAHLREAESTMQGRGMILRSLKAFKRHDAAFAEAARDRLSVEMTQKPAEHSGMRSNDLAIEYAEALHDVSTYRAPIPAGTYYAENRRAMRYWSDDAYRLEQINRLTAGDFSSDAEYRDFIQFFFNSDRYGGSSWWREVDAQCHKDRNGVRIHTKWGKPIYIHDNGISFKEHRSQQEREHEEACARLQEAWDELRLRMAGCRASCMPTWTCKCGEMKGCHYVCDVGRAARVLRCAQSQFNASQMTDDVHTEATCGEGQWFCDCERDMQPMDFKYIDLRQYYSADGTPVSRPASKRDAPSLFRTKPGGEGYDRTYDCAITKTDYTKRGLQVVELDNGSIVAKHAKLRIDKAEQEEFEALVHRTHKLAFDESCRLCIREAIGKGMREGMRERRRKFRGARGGASSDAAALFMLHADSCGEDDTEGDMVDEDDRGQS